MSSLGGLLALKVVGESLGLNGVGTKEEELLASDQVPAEGVSLAAWPCGFAAAATTSAQSGTRAEQCEACCSQGCDM